MITIVGLGVSATLSAELRAMWHAAPRVVVRTAQHPCLVHESRAYSACDDLITQPDAIAQIVDRVLASAEDTLYVVPGHPRVGDATVAELMRRAPQRCRIVPGVHPIDAWHEVVGTVADAATQQYCDVLACLPDVDGRDSWATFHSDAPYPAVRLPLPVQPHAPAWITNIVSLLQLRQLQQQLAQYYHAAHACVLLDALLQPHPISMGQLHSDSASAITFPCTLFLPAVAPLENVRSPDGIAYVILRLLGPAGCPWDHEQTPQSLRGTLLEETYEALDALDRGDDVSLVEELGDIVLNILMQAEMARQAGRFSMSDVYAQVATKFIRRHPHVFGDVDARDSETVLNNWYAIKQTEGKQSDRPKSPLAGVPHTLPALSAATAMIHKSKRYGLTLTNVSDQPPTLADIGEQLFAIAVNAAYHSLDAESALREINARYRAQVDALFGRDGHLNGQTQELWRDADFEA